MLNCVVIGAEQQVQKNNYKVYVEMKKLLDAFIKKYQFIKN